MVVTRRLRVFLCHASQDKPAVRELYKRLAAEKWIDPWLDEEEILPGQDWNHEIEKAIRSADAILICLSSKSVSKEGYVQKEIKRALDIAAEKPDGTIFIVPLRLEECEVPPRLSKWQWVDLFTPNAHEKLIKSLRLRAGALNIETSENIVEPIVQPKIPTQDVDLDLYRFIQIPATAEVPYSFYIGKYPVTNAQYERFLNARDYSEAVNWRGFLKFNEDCIQIGRWHEEGWDWFQQEMKDPRKFLDKKRVIPKYWNDQNFGISNPENPVAGITWFESNAYCNWLIRHWNGMAESGANASLHPLLIRLPLETEWVTAAGGENPVKRYPWDTARKATTDIKEIVKRANIEESHIGHTTPVNAYLRGVSPYGVMDMAGNVWEWQANYRNMEEGRLGLRGGSWLDSADFARVSIRDHDTTLPLLSALRFGFRVVVTIPNK